MPFQDSARPACAAPTRATTQAVSAVVNRLSPRPSTTRPASKAASADDGGKAVETM